MSEIENEKMEMTTGLFFGILVSAGTTGHVKHLQCKGEGSYAAHKALQGFYEDVVEVADTVIELYQGYSKEIVDYDDDGFLFGVAKDQTPMMYLEDLRTLVQGYRYDIIPEEETHIHNELDNFVALIDSTVYKLTFLK